MKIEDRSYDLVFAAGLDAVRATGALLRSQDREKGEIRAIRGSTWVTWGDAVGVFITPADPAARSFEVTVVDLPTDPVRFPHLDATPVMLQVIKDTLHIYK